MPHFLVINIYGLKRDKAVSELIVGYDSLGTSYSKPAKALMIAVNGVDMLKRPVNGRGRDPLNVQVANLHRLLTDTIRSLGQIALVLHFSSALAFISS